MTDAPAWIISAAARDAAPGLADYSTRVVGDSVWARPGLSRRDKSLVTAVVLVCVNRPADFGAFAPVALDSGVTPRELSEIVTHLAFYCGWPYANAAATALAAAYRERGIDASEIVSLGAPKIEPDAEAEKARQEGLALAVAPVSQSLVDYTEDVLFSDLWLRPDLAPRDRCLVTVSALVTLGQPEQLGYHAPRALDHGVTEAELGDVLTHLAFYAGWPKAMSAAGVIKRVIEDRKS